MPSLPAPQAPIHRPSQVRLRQRVPSSIAVNDADSNHGSDLATDGSVLNDSLLNDPVPPLRFTDSPVPDAPLPELPIAQGSSTSQYHSRSTSVHVRSDQSHEPHPSLRLSSPSGSIISRAIFGRRHHPLSSHTRPRASTVNTHPSPAMASSASPQSTRTPAASPGLGLSSYQPRSIGRSFQRRWKPDTQPQTLSTAPSPIGQGEYQTELCPSLHMPFLGSYTSSHTTQKHAPQNPCILCITPSSTAFAPFTCFCLSNSIFGHKLTFSMGFFKRTTHKSRRLTGSFLLALVINGHHSSTHQQLFTARRRWTWPIAHLCCSSWPLAHLPHVTTTRL